MTFLRRTTISGNRYSKRLTGDFIDYGTPVKTVTDWIEKVYLRRDFTGFTGDLKFVRDNDAQKAFSKLRSSIGGVYSWRLYQAAPEYKPKSNAELQTLLKEADFAFLQAFAFCPYSPEAVFRYVQLLLQFNRIDDAMLIARTCLKLDPYNSSVTGLVDQLKAIQAQQTAAEHARNSLQSMEEQIRTNPSNFKAAWELAGTYLSLQQTDRAVQILSQVVRNPQLGADMILGIAQVFADVKNWTELEFSLDKLVKVSPDSPEAWYNSPPSRPIWEKGRKRSPRSNRR